MSRRDEFLQLALQLINKKGFKAMTMRDLAAAMDCEVANIYNYIESKDWLLQTFLFELSAEFHTGIDNIRSSDHEPIDKVKAIISLYVRISLTDPYKASLLANEWRNLQEPLLTKFLQERNSYERKVRKVLTGALSPSLDIDPDLVTQTFLASVRWLFAWKNRRRKLNNTVELERQLTEIILHGLLGRITGT